MEGISYDPVEELSHYLSAGTDENKTPHLVYET
jgi:hypothetical protein